MDKIYVVFYVGEHSEKHIIGAFSSEARANDAIEETALLTLGPDDIAQMTKDDIKGYGSKNYVTINLPVDPALTSFHSLPG